MSGSGDPGSGAAPGLFAELLCRRTHRKRFVGPGLRYYLEQIRLLRGDPMCAVSNKPRASDSTTANSSMLALDVGSHPESSNDYETIAEYETTEGEVSSRCSEVCIDLQKQNTSDKDNEDCHKVTKIISEDGMMLTSEKHIAAYNQSEMRSADREGNENHNKYGHGKPDDVPQGDYSHEEKPACTVDLCTCFQTERNLRNDHNKIKNMYCTCQALDKYSSYEPTAVRDMNNHYSKAVTFLDQNNQEQNISNPLESACVGSDWSSLNDLEHKLRGCSNDILLEELAKKVSKVKGEAKELKYFMSLGNISPDFVREKTSVLMARSKRLNDIVNSWQGNGVSLTSLSRARQARKHADSRAPGRQFTRGTDGNKPDHRRTARGSGLASGRGAPATPVTILRCFRVPPSCACEIEINVLDKHTGVAQGRVVTVTTSHASQDVLLEFALDDTPLKDSAPGNSKLLRSVVTK